jgi:hypothetical protein
MITQESEGTRSVMQHFLEKQIHTHTYTHTYMHMHIHTFTYTHAYMHTLHIHTERERERERARNIHIHIHIHIHTIDGTIPSHVLCSHRNCILCHNGFSGGSVCGNEHTLVAFQMNHRLFLEGIQLERVLDTHTKKGVSTRRKMHILRRQKTDTHSPTGMHEVCTHTHTHTHTICIQTSSIQYTGTHAHKYR